MLICMAWHRHLASRYGGSTFLSCFCPRFFYWRFPSEFKEQERGEIIIPAGVLGGGWHNTNDIPPAGAIRLQTWGGDKGAGKRGLGGAGTHVLYDKTSRVEGVTTTGHRPETKMGFVCRLGTGLAWRDATEEDNDGDGALRCVNWDKAGFPGGTPNITRLAP
jgi:hypothetical protein